jgi:ethanolamine utilization cobalamin adenosyltransferase
MDFITEDHLRTQYHTQPFPEYHVQEGTRLTPSARQFLSDRKVCIFENGILVNRRISLREHDSRTCVPVENEAFHEQVAESSEISELKNEIETLEAHVLLSGSEIITDNINMAQQILAIGSELASLRNYISGGGQIVFVGFTSCDGINEENCSKDQGNCFEITDIYIRSANAKRILTLNYLRSRVRGIRILASKVFCGTERFTVIEAVTNKIVNKLSGMICIEAGVNECEIQKKKESVGGRSNVG